MEDLVAVVEAEGEFWGERSRAELHHPMLIHEFGETALVAREPGGGVIGYLFGFVTIEGVGYAHLVAVREGHRRRGLARALYGEFEQRARARGARALKAFTRPENERSIAFHASLGMSATAVADYSGPGETRVVFWRDLE